MVSFKSLTFQLGAMWFHTFDMTVHYTSTMYNIQCTLYNIHTPAQLILRGQPLNILVKNLALVGGCVGCLRDGALGGSGGAAAAAAVGKAEAPEDMLLT